MKIDPDRFEKQMGPYRTNLKEKIDLATRQREAELALLLKTANKLVLPKQVSRILVVENEPVQRNLFIVNLSRQLQRAADVDVTRDSNEAMEFLKINSNDIGLIVIGKENIFSCDELQGFRNSSFGIQVPIIVLTSRPLLQGELEQIGNIMQMDKLTNLPTNFVAIVKGLVERSRKV